MRQLLCLYHLKIDAVGRGLAPAAFGASAFGFGGSSYAPYE